MTKTIHILTNGGSVISQAVPAHLPDDKAKKEAVRLVDKRFRNSWNDKSSGIFIKR